MNIYTLQKLYGKIRSPRVKLLALLLLHLGRRRYAVLDLDPVMACNLRCRMCYFSDENHRRKSGGRMSEDDLAAISRNVFPAVRKLQIGCGAEPTLFSGLEGIVAEAKKQGVPYISLTTNGQLLTAERLERLVETGLDEITVSAHGLSADVYESMMPGARFGKFLDLTRSLASVREKHPRFQIRFNYTVNEDNMQDLPLLGTVFSDVVPDIVQIRPVQCIGESDYRNFSKKKILEHYGRYMPPVVEFCRKHGARCIYPSKENLASVDGTTVTDTTNHIADDLPLLYMAPCKEWPELDPYKEDFRQYCRRTHRVGTMLRIIFGLDPGRHKNRSKTMNYDIR